MTTSVLSENTLTKKTESHVVNDSLENITELLAGLDELLTQLSDEIAKQDPIYDIPRPIESDYDIPRSALSTYDYPKSHYDTPKPTESNYDVPKPLTKRPLPPTPIMVNEPIYEEISSFKSPKDSIKIKASLQQAKVHLLKSLRRCVHSVHKVFEVIRTHQSNNGVKTVWYDQSIINLDPIRDTKIMVDLAESKFLVTGSLDNLQALIKSLNDIVFVLEERVTNFSKVYESEYQQMLGAKLMLPMAEAKQDLSRAQARLAEVKGLETELTLINSTSTQTLVSTANNRSTLFGKTARTVTTVENPLYDSIDVIKGMTMNAS